MKVLSFQIAESIDIKAFRSAFTGEIYYADTDELFYFIEKDKYVYLFKYGVVCFINFDDVAISAFLTLILHYCRNPFETRLSEEFLIEIGAKELKFGFNKIELIEADIETIRLIMLNVSQSVALDYYSDQTNILLVQTNLHIQRLEKYGRLQISGTNLKKFIGRTLNLKSKISENLYIFDSPPETWENESLNKIDIGLKKTFDLQVRFRNIQDGLQIIKENFELFKDIMQYRNSNLLEWIIIVLITVEVINLILEKIIR